MAGIVLWCSAVSADPQRMQDALNAIDGKPVPADRQRAYACKDAINKIGGPMAHSAATRAKHNPFDPVDIELEFVGDEPHRFGIAYFVLAEQGGQTGRYKCIVTKNGKAWRAERLE